MILNGTLCDARLWEPFCILLKEEGVFDTFCHPLLDDGGTVVELAHTVGDALAYAIRASNATHAKSEALRTGVRPWLLGYSLGGVVALEAVKHYQDRISGLILVSTKGNAHNKEKAASVAQELAYMKKEGVGALLDTILLPAYFGEQISRYPKEAQAVRESGIRMGAEAFINQRRTIESRIDQHEHLSAVHIPTLIVCGQQDILCTPQQSRALHRAIPNSTLCVYPEAGHALPWICTTTLVRDVAAFVGAAEPHPAPTANTTK